MSDAVERMMDSPDTKPPVTRTAIRRMPSRHHPSSRSLFAMAAWKRMAIGLVALLFLWLAILWAMGA